MDRFRELSIFAAVAEEGAFNAAARRLNLSASVVTRLVNALEARIGARLFTRTTRRVALTEAGDTLFASAGRILEHLEEAEAAAAGAHQVPRGLLRLTAPVLFGQRYLAPIIRDYLDSYPEVSVATVFLDRTVNLIDEGFDVALRIGALPDSSASAIRVGMVRHVTVAAPGYLSEHGTPRRPDDLSEHRIIGAGPLHGPREWSFHADGKMNATRITPRLTVNAITAGVDAAIAGWGVCRVLSYQVADALARGELVEILSAWEDRQLPVQLVHSEGGHAAAKTRAFLDLAAARLRADAGTLAAM